MTTIHRRPRSTVRGASAQAAGTGLMIFALTAAPCAFAGAPGEDGPFATERQLQWALQSAFGRQGTAAPAAERALQRGGEQTVLQGAGATRDGAGQGVALGPPRSGTGLFRGGKSTLQVGDLTTVDGDGTMAVGHFSAAVGNYSIAMGFNAGTEGTGGESRIAIGAGSRAGSDGWSGAIAVGGESQSAYDGIAVGHRAKAVASSTIAQGRYATASAQGAIALGGSSTASGANALAFGREASAGGEAALALGGAATAAGKASLALGRNASAAGKESLAIGRSAQAEAWSSFAIGAGSRSQAEGGLAIGYQAHVDQSAAKFAVALGERAKASHRNAVALGAGSTTSASDQVSVGNAGLKRKLVNVADAALSAGSSEAVTGRQLFATAQQVAENTGSLTTQGQQIAAHDDRITRNRDAVATLKSQFDDIDLSGVVRRADDGSIDMNGAGIRGLAAGDISSAGSTDAVNGGQLFATNQRLQAVEGVGRFVAIGAGGNQQASAAGNFAVAIGDSASASPGNSGGVAVGAYASALGENSVALGRAATIADHASNSFALGARSLVAATDGMALGAESHVEETATDSVALGSKSVASQANTVSLGHDTLKRRLVNVASGIGANDAVIVEQLQDTLAVLGGDAGLGPGGKVVAPAYHVQGGTQRTVGEALDALDGVVNRSEGRVDQLQTTLDSVFGTLPSPRADGRDQLTFAGINGMVLSNVADGRVGAGSRDAVNGGQLHALERRIDGRVDGLEQRIDGQSQVRTGSAADGDATTSGTALTGTQEPTTASPPLAAAGEQVPTDGGTLSSSGAGSNRKAQVPEPPKPPVETAELEKMLARANEYTDGAVSHFERRLEKMDKRFNRMAAMSSAQSAMAMNTAGLATYNRLGAGVGYSDGESAMAVGYQRVLTERGSATVSLNGAFTNSGERSMGLGVGIGW